MDLVAMELWASETFWVRSATKAWSEYRVAFTGVPRGMWTAKKWRLLAIIHFKMITPNNER
jgi:hypothetical protein